ncbi:MAG: GntP family permease [Methylocystaceae bacterium]
MEWLGPVGILVALLAIMFLAMRSYSILVIGPFCALIVILTNKMDIISALVSAPNSYMMGLAGFIAKYFLVFLFGAILGKYMEDSGAARSIAQSIIKLTGTDRPYAILVAVFLISALLTYGGVNLFVAIFAVLPLARPLFKQFNIPWHLFIIPVALGMATFTMTMLPGSPSIQNVIPTTPLHTTLTAAPLVGFVGTLVVILWGLWYMRRQLSRSVAAGEDYIVTAADNASTEQRDLPTLFRGLIPPILLLIIIILGSIKKVDGIILPALILAIIVAAIIFKPFIKNQLTTLNTGAVNAMTPAFFTAAAVGFGVVVAAAPGFKIIAQWIMSIPGSPLISLSVATNLLAAVTASSSGSLGIVMEAFAKTYLALGVSPDAIHRIAAMSSGGLSALPHSGAIFTLMAVTGLTHKDGYRHIFWVVLVGQLLALIPALLLAIVMY